MMPRAAIFFDRDGVLNSAVVRDGRPYPPLSVDQLTILPGASDALAALAAAGYVLVAVTNQPDVARGTQRREAVEAINHAVMTALPLDDLRVCYHDNSDDCDCRKPKPGMLLDSARTHDLDLRLSVMVGDRWSDVEAGRRAGCTTVLIGTGYGEPNPWSVIPDANKHSLADVAAWILERDRQRSHQP